MAEKWVVKQRQHSAEAGRCGMAVKWPRGHGSSGAAVAETTVDRKEDTAVGPQVRL